MAARVQVNLDDYLPEHVNAGWKKSKLAKDIVSVSIEGGEVRHQSLPSQFWREPSTGIIMRRPGVFSADYWEGPWDGQHIFTDNLVVPPTSPILAYNDNKNFTTKRTSLGDAIDDIAVLVAAAVNEFAAVLGTTMTPFVETDFTLDINEGFAVWVHPYSYFTDRGFDLIAINFGGKYGLHLNQNGTAYLYCDLGFDHGTATNWTQVMEMKWADGSANNGEPFQISIIPFGGFIGFYFSQAPDPGHKLGPRLAPVTAPSSYLYDVAKSEKITLTWYAPLQQYIKTYADPVTILVNKHHYNYGLAIGRVGYEVGSASFYGSVEQLPGLLAYAPAMTWEGFENLGNITLDYTNSDGDPWALSDIHLLPHITMECVNSKYTPELWAIHYSVDPYTSVPEVDLRDVSTQWRKIRLKRSIDPKIHQGSIQLERGSRVGDDLIRAGGRAISINILDDSDVLHGVFKGAGVRFLPTLESYQTIRTDEYTLHDAWYRLEETPVDDYQFLESKLVIDVVVDLIKKCGFRDEDIVFTDTDGYVSSFLFPDFQDPNDRLGINPDVSVADAIRAILKYYWAVPLRVIPKGDGKWYIYLEPQYDGTTPTVTFTLVDPGMSDIAQRAARIYKVHSNMEWSCEEINFNNLIGRSMASNAQGVLGLSALVPGNAGSAGIWAWDTINDVTNPFYIGRVKTKVIGPSEFGMVYDQEELNMLTRIYWEKNRKNPARLEVVGTWDWNIDLDDFVWVIGVDAAGDPCSYGAYRIENMDIEMDLDDPLVNTVWATSCRYTLVLVGATSDVSYPMFTAEENLPI